MGNVARIAMVVGVGIALVAEAAWAGGGRSGEPEALPFWEWNAPQLHGSVRQYQTTRLDGEPAGRLRVRLARGRGEERGDSWFGEAAFTLPTTSRLRGVNWDTRFRLSAEVRIGPALVNAFRHHRARLFLVDAQGLRQYLPNEYIGLRPPATQGWITLQGRPVTSIPVPLGFTDPGFRADQIVSVGVNFEAGGRDGESQEDWIELRGLQLEDLGTQTVARLTVDPAIITEEAARAARMTTRWRERFGTAPHPNRSIYGVNLAWPSVRAPDGQLLQLYGSFLEAPAAWYGSHWDLARNPAVEQALRQDFRGIRDLFGPQAIVRMFLFADVRSGIEFNAQGIPVRFTPTALQSLDRLFALALEEQVVLMPCLFDFLMADGKANPPAHPGDYWLGEAAQLITQPEARTAMIRLIGELATRYRDHAALLAWDIMNEPENAVAVVTPENWVHLQTFLKESVDAVQTAGELATVGHRNPLDARDQFRGVLRTSLGQAHYYPNLETRPAPFSLNLRQQDVFGAVPGGWGEVPAREGRIDQDFADGRNGNSAYFLFWSWRGDDENGDGFKVRAYHAEIAQALRRHGPIPYLFTMDDFPMWFVPDPVERRAAYQYYRQILRNHGARGVMFVNGQYIDQSPDPQGEWQDLTGYLEDGHFLANHGGQHKPLSEVSWEQFWADTQAGLTSLDQHAPGWQGEQHFYRFPNSYWGREPEYACRRITQELSARILPVTADMQDTSFNERYHYAASATARQAIRNEAFRKLENDASLVRAHRQRQATRPAHAEVFILHSTRFARDHLDAVLTALERNGVRWVDARSADLADYAPKSQQCAPDCKYSGACR